MKIAALHKHPEKIGHHKVIIDCCYKTAPGLYREREREGERERVLIEVNSLDALLLLDANRNLILGLKTTSYPRFLKYFIKVFCKVINDCEYCSINMWQAKPCCYAQHVQQPLLLNGYYIIHFTDFHKIIIQCSVIYFC